MRKHNQNSKPREREIPANSIPSPTHAVRQLIPTKHNAKMPETKATRRKTIRTGFRSCMTDIGSLREHLVHGHPPAGGGRFGVGDLAAMVNGRLFRVVLTVNGNGFR